MDTKQTLALAAEVQACCAARIWAASSSVMYGNEPTSGAGPGRARAHALHHQRADASCASARPKACSTSRPRKARVPRRGLHALVRRARPADRHQPTAFAHWSTLGLVNRPDLLAIDTGCVWGGALTAVRVDGGRREVVQVRCEQAQRPGA
jgi:bis(5'-nucleosyl)-tetraphosphatase (symmetrical)